MNAEKHTTYTGRVVYERATHYFTEADIQRILKCVSRGKPTSFLVQLMHSVEKYMLELILAPLGQADKADVVRELLENLVGSILAWAGGVFKVKIIYVDGNEEHVIYSA